jgi:uncharacterized protein YecE (DUF72 family)
MLGSGLLIGTSGWSYPRGEGSWKSNFYPPAVDELTYYSRYFQLVEINSTFYHPPTPEVARNWVRKTPESFIFTVKLWQKFTHPKMYEEATGKDAAISTADIEQFEKGIAPLKESGKMGVLLAQFPPSFQNSTQSRRVLEAIISAFGHHQLAVELRDKSWSDNTVTAKLLTTNNVCWVRQDEPHFERTISAELPQTADIAYFRFHGRNREMWWKGNNETRYRYRYSPEEIAELARQVEAVAKKAKLTFVLFNNHWKGYAPRNAIQMIRRLGGQIDAELPAAFIEEGL